VGVDACLSFFFVCARVGEMVSCRAWFDAILSCATFGALFRGWKNCVLLLLLLLLVSYNSFWVSLSYFKYSNQLFQT
jgi:hypothetical protein